MYLLPARQNLILGDKCASLVTKKSDIIERYINDKQQELEIRGVH